MRTRQEVRVNVMQRFNRMLGERMAASGRMAMIEVTGRTSGRRIRTPVGYVRNADGSIWVGAGRAESHWPRNLQANPSCRVRAGSVDGEFAAVELAGEERARAVAAIHAKYGAPAARVGTGPVFVLRPAEAGGSADPADEAETGEAAA
jgi:deazaflavin-dependent oxidoreductase (nitroreductase family)